MKLASVGNPEQAAAAFEAGAAKAPDDKRFPVELAGLAYRAKEFDRAKRLLHTALNIDRQDTYANDFLATIYFLDGNIEAALKYWNRTGKPLIQDVSSEPVPQLDAVLLDRAFTFAPGTMLTMKHYRETQQRLDLLQVYRSYRLDAIARPDGRYDVVFRNDERNRLGRSKASKLLNVFGRLPFQTVGADVYNLRGEGANLRLLYRFNAQRRRLFSSYSAPLRGDPKWRYGLNVDLRKENWDLRYPNDLSDVARSLTLEKAAAAAQLQRILSADWRWTTGVEVAQRRFSKYGTATTVDRDLARSFLRDGSSLKYYTQIEGSPLRVPERRFVTTMTARTEVGKWWTSPAHSFVKLQGGVGSQWMPQRRGDDYALNTQVRVGKTFGSIPFDELNVLGVDNDNDLWLRGHDVAHESKKGAAPMGRDYVLFNNEWDKNVYTSAPVSVKVGPFLDAGRITDASGVLGSREWLVDAGLQIKLRLFGGFGATLIFGRGLTDGRHALKASALR